MTGRHTATASANDPRIHLIANCGKGHLMQTKKLLNGGLTMWSRAILTGGR
jgi:hypothetical protein